MMGPRRECIAVIHRKVHGMGRSIYAGRSVENTSERVCVTVNCSVVLALMILVLSDAFADSKENIRIDMRFETMIALPLLEPELVFVSMKLT